MKPYEREESKDDVDREWDVRLWVQGPREVCKREIKHAVYRADRVPPNPLVVDFATRLTEMKQIEENKTQTEQCSRDAHPLHPMGWECVRQIYKTQSYDHTTAEKEGDTIHRFLSGLIFLQYRIQQGIDNGTDG
jgi:hypothetical protein